MPPPTPQASSLPVNRPPSTCPCPPTTACRSPSSTWWTIERLGLLKMDFLGLRTLTVIHDTEMAVRHTKDPDFRVANIDYDDPAAYEMLTRGETMGVFQLESTGMTQVLMQHASPKNLEDVIAADLACIAPARWIPSQRICDNRNDPSEVVYQHPADGPISWM